MVKQQCRARFTHDNLKNKGKSMIDGFRLRFTAQELASHLTDRAQYHRGREADKAGQLPKLKEAMDQIKAVGEAKNVATMSKGGYHSEDPVADLERDIRDHHNKALVFDLFAVHLFEDDYNLKEDDLIRLEILRR
jgi:hypothetical protein